MGVTGPQRRLTETIPFLVLTLHMVVAGGLVLAGLAMEGPAVVEALQPALGLRGKEQVVVSVTHQTQGLRLAVAEGKHRPD